MPIYVCLCECGEEFVELYSISQAGFPQVCPTCGKLAPQVIGGHARTPRKWEVSVGNKLDSIQRQHKGNISDDIKERHSH